MIEPTNSLPALSLIAMAIFTVAVAGGAVSFLGCKRSELKEDIIRWFAYGETGISSVALACAIVDMAPDPKRSRAIDRASHPRDPADFLRCVKFLNEVPGARRRLGKVADVSPIWASLVQNWDELERLLTIELEKSEKVAPFLYQRMKELGC